MTSALTTSFVILLVLIAVVFIIYGKKKVGVALWGIILVALIFLLQLHMTTPLNLNF